MGTKVFTDTNIIIDLIQQRPFELALIHKLVTLAESGDIEIFISESVVTNALYITRLEKHIEKVLSFSKIICIGEEIIINALKSDFKDKEDAILYFGAMKAGIDYFITRDPKDYTKHSPSQLPVVSIKQFFKLTS
jgi:predicted nucleic acid-binding protein